MRRRENGTNEMHDDFAVGVGLEDGGVLETLSECSVVVDFSVDGEDESSFFVGERLSSGVYFFFGDGEIRRELRLAERGEVGRSRNGVG